MSDKCRKLLEELITYDEEAFDNDDEVDAADLVEWFAEFRAKVKIALANGEIANDNEEDKQ